MKRLSIIVSQTSFSHISINSSLILTVSMATESPWKELLIDTSHVLRWSILAEILGRSTGNHYGTIYYLDKKLSIVLVIVLKSLSVTLNSLISN